jgi:xylulose-5-phosphate/fructose-6-phosphate phosphoketolase
VPTIETLAAVKLLREHLDRFHLVDNFIERVPGLLQQAGALRRTLHDKLAEHQAYICEHGQDLPEILDWQWQERSGGD